ncbi:MAG: DUF4058 family protein [Bacteroidota bacterium]
MAQKNPQVGMWPALEQPRHFPDLHASLSVYIRDWLSPRLPEAYSISVERGLSTLDDFGEPRRYRPDVRIDRKNTPSTVSSEISAVDAPSFAVDVPSQPQRYLTVRDGDENLVTTIEILSPANKTGDGYEDFRRKQENLSEQQIHLVEIDLLTQGKRRWRNERVDAADYVVTVQRGTSEIANVWVAALGEALPTIPIPLRSPDVDVPLPVEVILQEYLTKSGVRRRLG